MRTLRFVQSWLLAVGIAMAAPACDSTEDQVEVSAGDPGWGAFRFNNRSGPDFWITYHKDRGWGGLMMEAPYFSQVTIKGYGPVQQAQSAGGDIPDFGELAESTGGGAPAFSA